MEPDNNDNKGTIDPACEFAKMFGEPANQYFICRFLNTHYLKSVMEEKWRNGENRTLLFKIETNGRFIAISSPFSRNWIVESFQASDMGCQILPTSRKIFCLTAVYNIVSSSQNAIFTLTHFVTLPHFRFFFTKISPIFNHLQEFLIFSVCFVEYKDENVEYYGRKSGRIVCCS